MAFSSKVSDQGWFYHAPSKPKPRTTDPVLVPPISQIPGLSNVYYLPEEETSKRLWIRDSDSDYIRLAKQGGRPDLLMMRPTKPPSEQPVGYPRCEWYYDSHVDPDLQQIPDKPYEFLLPDYMVHQPLKPRCEQTECGVYNAEQTPYAFDKSTVYDREGHKANDKTVKVDEERKIGYGVRTEKQQKKNANKSSSQNMGAKGDSDARKNGENISKLLSYGYENDYDTQRQKYQLEKCKQSDKGTSKMNNTKQYTAKNQKGNPCKGARKR